MQAHVNRALLAHANVESIPERVQRAFVALRDERRRRGNSFDRALAAAAHSLFARALVAKRKAGKARMDATALGYDAGNSFPRSPRAEDATTVAANRPSRGSAGSVRRGPRGSADGEADRVRHNVTGTAPRVIQGHH
ncbi:MAG: hypothetical protein IPK81_24145 [Rhodospirillales bacterium]|nr:MAG: hypothetical protein IPK81_24145 [Rhodospirillales bacterium]